MTNFLGSPAMCSARPAPPARRRRAVRTADRRPTRARQGLDDPGQLPRPPPHQPPHRRDPRSSHRSDPRIDEGAISRRSCPQPSRAPRDVRFRTRRDRKSYIYHTLILTVSLAEAVTCSFAPPTGLEPVTTRLTVGCSAIELRRIAGSQKFTARPHPESGDPGLRARVRQDGGISQSRRRETTC